MATKVPGHSYQVHDNSNFIHAYTHRECELHAGPADNFW